MIIEPVPQPAVPPSRPLNSWHSNGRSAASQKTNTCPPVPLSGAEYLAARVGEAVEVPPDLELVPKGELQLALQWFVAVAATSDFRSPVAHPSGQKLDGIRAECSTGATSDGPSISTAPTARAIASCWSSTSWSRACTAAW
ncbi:hypothetical protein ACFY1L_52335 [Streptomyces sp. NPDC001663]|uniref:hypothetical protein n=1 Tax=Streptomyces sp. NPDC001663 TaxID=3364597 RepID=UPI0036AA7722